MTLETSTRPQNATPWLGRSASQTRSILLASVLPAVIAIGLSQTLHIAGLITVVLVFLPLQLIFAATAGYRARGRIGVPDALLSVAVYFAVALVLILLGSIVQTLIVRGLHSLRPSFILQNNHYVSLGTPLEYGGAGHAVLGTLVVVGLSTLITVPFGIAIAIYLTETNGRFRGFVRTIVQSMSGLPSIVSGLFIYAAIILSGISSQIGFTGSLALSLLMLPTVARTAEEVLKLVPGDLRWAAVALGASRKAAFFQVILPAARAGIVTAILLGIARVIGETAPLLMTTIPTTDTNVNPFSGQITTMPTYVYRYVTDPHDSLQHRAWAASLLMMIIVAIIFIAARIATTRSGLKK